MHFHLMQVGRIYHQIQKQTEKIISFLQIEVDLRVKRINKAIESLILFIKSQSEDSFLMFYHLDPHLKEFFNNPDIIITILQVRLVSNLKQFSHVKIRQFFQFNQEYGILMRIIKLIRNFYYLFFDRCRRFPERILNFVQTQATLILEFTREEQAMDKKFDMVNNILIMTILMLKQLICQKIQ
ncbi:unnamed protein product [Paramecium octaurelia]|uniref:Uncharacterized protein n=1 Tax=Paramecium octaurelia TaxID=43137 RepID=A0A8S1Y3Y5_PAROT|nr:unnamed protein product [Paramecium octaurelia]